MARSATVRACQDEPSTWASESHRRIRCTTVSLVLRWQKHINAIMVKTEAIPAHHTRNSWLHWTKTHRALRIWRSIFAKQPILQASLYVGQLLNYISDHKLHDAAGFGNFRHYVTENYTKFGFGYKTAERCMKAARLVDNLPSNLPIMWCMPTSIHTPHSKTW